MSDEEKSEEELAEEARAAAEEAHRKTLAEFASRHGIRSRMHAAVLDVVSTSLTSIGVGELCDKFGSNGTRDIVELLVERGTLRKNRAPGLKDKTGLWVSLSPRKRQFFEDLKRLALSDAEAAAVIFSGD